MSEHRHCARCQEVITMDEFHRKWEETMETRGTVSEGRSGLVHWYRHHMNIEREEIRPGYGDAIRIWGLCGECAVALYLREPICTSFLFLEGGGMGPSSTYSVWTNNYAEVARGVPLKPSRDSSGHEQRLCRCVLGLGHQGIHATEIGGGSVNWEG